LVRPKIINKGNIMKTLVMTVSLMLLGSCAHNHHGSHHGEGHHHGEKKGKTCRPDKSCCKSGSCSLKKKKKKCKGSCGLKKKKH